MSGKDNIIWDTDNYKEARTMNKEELIMDFIKWTHAKCFTLEGVVDEDIRRMVQMYLKEREQ